VFDSIDGYRIKRRIKRIEAEEGFIGWTYNYIQTEEKWKPYFIKVLNNTALVNSLETAVKLNQKYPSFNFATPQGDIIFTNGIVEAGGLANMDDSLFGRKLLLENLRNEFPNINEKIESIKEKIVETESYISAIDLKAISEQGKMLENDINTLDKQIAKFEFEKNKNEEEIEKAYKQINEGVKEANFIEQQIAEEEKQLNELRENKNLIKDAIIKQEQETKTLEEDYSKTVSEYNQQMIELERNKGKIINLRNDIKRGQDTERNISATIERRKKDIENAKEEIISNNYIIEEKEADLEQITYDRQLLINEEKKIEAELGTIKQESSKFEQQLSNCEAEDRFAVTEFTALMLR
jgi:chromosome segregation protein